MLNKNNNLLDKGEHDEKNSSFCNITDFHGVTRLQFVNHEGNNNSI